MKSLSFAVVLVLVFSAYASIEEVSRMIDEVNSANKNWVAGHNKFSTWSAAELKCLFGAKMVVKESDEVVERNLLGDIPSSFDARQKWGSCIHPIRNQEHCGSCWAFSATEVLSDRFCIAGKDVILSPEDLVACDRSDMGCSGGQLDTAWEFMVHSGVHTDACMPYTSGNGTTGFCPTDCKDGSQFNVIYKAASYKHIGAWIIGRVKDIEKEVYENGPVQAAFEVYQDFMSYTSGVYKHTSGSLLGGHAIKVIGWGNENGEDYWLVSNSWGTDWGQSGFFKILKGHNECEIESMVYAGPASA